jgi:hypothetical protein
MMLHFFADPSIGQRVCLLTNGRSIYVNDFA